MVDIVVVNVTYMDYITIRFRGCFYTKWMAPGSVNQYLHGPQLIKNPSSLASYASPVTVMNAVDNHDRMFIGNIYIYIVIFTSY